MDKIKIAIIGCGAVTRRHHLPALALDPRAQVVALYDRDRATADLLALRFKLDCPIMESEEALLHADADVVDICTPGPSHYGIAKRAMELGRHVMLEKPPVQRIAEAHDLIADARQRSVKIGTIFNNRYRAVCRELDGHIRAGLLGTITGAVLVHHANLVFGESAWLWDEKSSRYLVYELGIHGLDLLVHLLGEHDQILAFVPHVNEKVGQTTAFRAIIRFKSGATVSVDLAQDSTLHSTYRTYLELYGTGLDAQVRFFPPLVRLSAGAENPLGLLTTEFKSTVRLAKLLATRSWSKFQNQGHAIGLSQYLDWVAGAAEYPFALDKTLPTLRLLEDIADHIPAYKD
jgi:predicted dehydrogenase